MATEPTIAVLSAATAAPQRRAVNWYSTIRDYWVLTKPDVNFLILITTFAGFDLASRAGLSEFRIAPLIHTLLGTVLVAGGSGTLNQFLERSFDAQMRRTARRPLASERLTPSHVLWFGISMSMAGTVYLAVAVNALTSLLAIVTLLSYLFLYTPLKRTTPLCTLVGAFPGAVPPLIGWAAARGRLDPEAWALYAIVFLWQFPHFMAIAWMYREDYVRAGYLVLPATEAREQFVIWQTCLGSLALIPFSLIAGIGSKLGPTRSVGILLLGLTFLWYSARFAFRRSNFSARQLLSASIVYLPLVLALMMLNKR
jgi:heme o synthase